MGDIGKYHRRVRVEDYDAPRDTEPLPQDVNVVRDREHVVQVNRGDLAALREWLRQPNGAFIPRGTARLTFEAVAGGGILVRSKPYRARAEEGS